MTSAARIAANRANARKSTGPKTAAGKARVSRNARRHGLSRPLLYEGAYRPHVEALAREIASPDAGGERLALASNIAGAQLDLARISLAKRDLQDAANFGSTDAQYPCDWSALTQLERLDRYEQRAFTRRKQAIREFCKSKPTDGSVIEPAPAVPVTQDAAGDFCTKPSDANTAQWRCAAPTPANRSRRFLQIKANGWRCIEYRADFDGMRAARGPPLPPRDGGLHRVARYMDARTCVYALPSGRSRARLRRAMDGRRALRGSRQAFDRTVARPYENREPQRRYRV